VLRLLREGKPNKDIADALSMSESTVKVHVRQIMKKLDAENRTHAAFLASKIFQTAGERTSKAGEEQ
jgi:DNA-binding NarL/FixJ family response regulator